MLSNILDRISFWSLFTIIVSLPLFFLPFTKIPIETSKGFILIIGLSFVIISWAIARFFEGKIVVPKSYLVLSILGIVLVSLLSGIFSSSINFSLFGIMLDTNSFSFILSAFLLMFFSSVILKDIKKSRIVFLGFVFSSFALLIFQIFHIFFPKFFSLGFLFQKTDNLMGTFNSFSILASLIILISLFAFTFLTFSKRIKYLLGTVIFLALFIIILANFPFNWFLLGIFSLFIFIYKILISLKNNTEKHKIVFPVISFIIVIISLFFFMGGKSIGNFLPNYLNVSNLEVRPSFNSTLTIAQKAIWQDPILGAGSNLYSKVWDLHKPAVINNTRFWDSSFDSGFSSITTFMITNGILGIISWLLFFALLILSGFKSLFLFYKNKENLEKNIYFLIALYLFITALFYSVGPVMLLLAFVFLGMFLGLSLEKKNQIEFSYLNDPRKSFFIIIFLILVILGTIAFSFKYIEKFISISYFQKTISAQSIEIAEKNINKAISLYSNDLYLRTYSQVYLLKFNSLVTQGDSLDDNQKTDLKNSFDQAIKSAELAKKYNKNNYLNYKSLGLVYENALSIGVEGSFEKALEAYQEAEKLNPLNPSLKLSIARIYLTKNNTIEAKNYINQTLVLKKDYPDALIILSQIFKNEGDIKNAIIYAQNALSLVPQNKQLIEYLDSLKMMQNVSEVVAKEE